MIVRARSLLPITSAPVDNGALVLEDRRIKWLGRWRDCDVSAGETVLDLGEVALMPGLVNAHCHLDYTKMAGQIPPPKVFPDWVKNILAFKAHWSFSEFAESWLKGAHMLIQHGTTTVADIESVPELPAETWRATPLRMVSFLEITGVKSQRSAQELLTEGLDWIERWPASDTKEGALSPHALYSTAPDLMRRSAQVAAERNLLLSVHLAESEAEHRMYVDAKGPFYDWLKGQRKMDDCGYASPVRLAHDYGLLTPRLLVIHGNYLSDQDIRLIAEGGASVVHCPQSHGYFAHARFRYEELAQAGVNICLGTDSLASAARINQRSPELNQWIEMQLFAKTYPMIAPRDILPLVTTHPAKALRKSGQIGTLEPGAFGDLIALDYTGRVEQNAMCEELLYSPHLRDVFIGGERVHTPS